MGSPFKMKPKSPMMKALVGKQGNLPQHLQDKIKAAPESPAKSYGSKKKSPVMQKETKGKRKFGQVDAETREKQSIGKRGTGMQGRAGQRTGKIGGVTVKANIGKQRGATDLLQVGKDTYAKAKKYVKGKLGISKIAPPPKKYRKPGKNDEMLKSIKNFQPGVKLSSDPNSPRNQGKKKRPKLRSIPKKVGPGGQSPVKKRGVKALEAQRGTKNASPIKQQPPKKKDTKGKTKLPKLVVNTPKGPKAPRGPQSGKIGGVRVSIQTKGRSTKNTDLLEVGKKYYNKAKKYVKSKMN